MRASSTANVDLDTAQIALKTAALKAIQINLDYTNIVSLVDGTVEHKRASVWA